MIDGVSLNSSRGISRQFDSIDPFNIERIEVMSGASAVYGGGATGGIINIVTKKGVGGDTRFNTELGARSASRAMRTTTCARRSRSAAATTCSTAAWPSPTRRTARPTTAVATRY